MKKGKKTAIIVALILVVLGILISAGAIAMLNFNFEKMNTLTYVTQTHFVDEDFSSISVNGAECNVKIIPAEDGKCKIVCTEGESDTIYHTISVSEGNLKIERHDNRNWYEHFGIYFGSMEVAVYLPKSEYESLTVKTASGKIEIPDTFSFKNAKAESASGNILFCAKVENTLSAEAVSGKIHIENTDPEVLNAKSTSGNITIENVNVNSGLNVNAVSGRLTFSNIRCKELTAKTTSGDTVFENVIANGMLYANSTSGRVVFDGCDAESLYIKTTSGSVKGTLLSEKIFITSTSSGSIDVPRSASGGECEITTVSGNIEFKIK